MCLYYLYAMDKTNQIVYALAADWKSEKLISAKGNIECVLTVQCENLLLADLFAKPEP